MPFFAPLTQVALVCDLTSAARRRTPAGGVVHVLRAGGDMFAAAARAEAEVLTLALPPPAGRMMPDHGVEGRLYRLFSFSRR